MASSTSSGVPTPSPSPRPNLTQLLNSLLPDTTNDHVPQLRLCPDLETFTDRLQDHHAAIFEEIYFLVHSANVQTSAKDAALRQHTDTEQALNEALEIVEGLQREKTTLSNAVNRLSTLATQSIAPTTLSPAHPDPEKFDGTNPKLLPAFVKEMQMKLRMNKDWYPTEQEKMTYYVSRLTAKAYDQVDHGIGEDGHLTFPDVSTIVSLLCSSFGDSDEVNTASNKIFSMRQGHQPLTTFLPNWISTASKTKFNDDAKIAFLKQSLHRDILHRLSFLPDLPKTLHDFLDAVRKADALLRSLEPTYYQKKSIATTLPHHSDPATYVTPNLTDTPPATDDPMDLSAAQLQKTNFKVGNYDPATAKRKALTSQEKEARKAYAWHFKLCHYCLQRGHQLQACPTRPPRPDELRANAAATSDDAVDLGKA